MELNRKLVMTFKTTDDKKVSLTVDNPREDLTEEEVKKVIFEALDALEVTNGASHSEFKIMPNGEIRIIEIGARMGGDCIGSDLVKISTGYDFVKMTLDVS